MSWPYSLTGYGTWESRHYLGNTVVLALMARHASANPEGMREEQTQPLTDCSTWEIGVHTLMRQHSRADFRDMGAGEPASRALQESMRADPASCP